MVVIQNFATKDRLSRERENVHDVSIVTLLRKCTCTYAVSSTHKLVYQCDSIVVAKNVIHLRSSQSSQMNFSLVVQRDSMKRLASLIVRLLQQQLVFTLVPKIFSRLPFSLYES